MSKNLFFTSELPVGERLSIKRTRFEPKKVTGKEKRISIVSGIDYFMDSKDMLTESM